MPTYEYRCPAGHDFEAFFKMSDAKAELPCPTCGTIAARRMSAGSGFVFKGSGFYITDYGKDGKKDERAKTAASAESGSNAAATTAAAPKAEGAAAASKPAEPAAKPASDKSGNAPKSGPAK